MFLKEIQLEGFKSFANKTKIKFDDSLVGFVGPNGSGKSNINDAIKWALGEKSLKQLRGKQGHDFLFSGSQTKPKAKFAEVTLILDNSKKILDIKEDKVSLTRRLYRASHENEYYINKKRVRLKDVTSLFLNTGLGNSNLSIVSQGTVSKIAEAKPDQVRGFLNEAAGVSKYEYQKKESLRKLDAVQSNLEIIEVMHKELEKQVKPLKTQSSKARKYIEFKQDLESVELSLISKKFTNLEIELDKSDEEVKKEKLQKDISNTKLTNLTNKLSTSEKLNLDIDTKILKLQQKRTKSQSELNTLNNRNDEADLNTENAILEKHRETKLNYELNKDKIEKSKEKSKEVELKSGKIKTEIDDLEKNKSIKTDILNKAIYNTERNIQEQKLEKDKASNHTVNYILDNSKIFPGILGTVLNYVDIKKDDYRWIDFLLKTQINKLIVDSQETAFKIIDFIKDNNKGTIDLLIMNQYQDTFNNEKDLIVVEGMKGYLGFLPDFLKVHKNKLNKLITNFLHNWVVFDNVENAKKASLIINSRINIISRDGYLIKENFIIFGGSDTYDAVDYDSKIKSSNVEIELLKKEIEGLNEKLSFLNSSNNNLYTELIFEKQNIITYNQRLEEYESKLSNIENAYKNRFNKNISEVTTKVKKGKSKQKLIDEVSDLEKEIFYLNQTRANSQKEIFELHKDVAEQNKKLLKFTNLLQKKEIDKEKIEFEIQKINDILNNDYKMTKAQLLKKKLKLVGSIENAEIKVNTLRSEIDKLGYVNIDSIEIYEEVSKKYEEIKKSYIDIKESRTKLLDIIDDLDKQMVKKFTTVFKKVNEEFNKIFVSTFNGGSALLKYTDEGNLLESGVDILVKQKNKSITNLSLFSGGEKAMISLAFIFSIISVKKIPFLIMDEAEAALDESNVERYGKFCQNLNKKTQVMIVTHRPRTMELCDSLYGVTMQGKSGITQLVSVKLSEAKKFID